MATVSLYKWENFDAVKGWQERKGFALEGDLLSFNFVGETTEPADYLLPEGYFLGESNSGEYGVFDPKGNMCEIGHADGVPVLISSMGRVKLQKAA